jgi:hypothetical protein
MVFGMFHGLHRRPDAVVHRLRQCYRPEAKTGRQQGGTPDPMPS